MKISYRREMKHNYMIVEPEELEWCSYECRMLEANNIEGILEFQLSLTDGNARFYYEISSRQPLARILESQKLKGNQLRRMMFSVVRVLDNMERYLISESRVLLEPEYMYVEPETFSVWLCLIPGLDTDFSKKLGDLLEYLLGRIDHQDRDGVVLAYGLFQETRKENYGMQDILRFLKKNDQNKEEKKLMQKAEKQEFDEDIRTRQEKNQAGDIGEKLEKTEGEEIKYTEKVNLQENKKENVFEMFFHKIKDFCSQIIIKVKKPQKQEEEIQVSWENMFGFDDSEPIPQEEAGTLREEGNIVGKSIENQKKEENDHDTVLLADLETEEEPGHHRLCALEREEEDIVLYYYPFIIGKQENLVDYVLKRETVSRLHLKIEQQGEDYYIQDLNSTNGTTVSGHLLENNEKVLLYSGDEVSIARYRYQFE